MITSDTKVAPADIRPNDNGRFQYDFPLSRASDEFPNLPIPMSVYIEAKPGWQEYWQQVEKRFAKLDPLIKVTLGEFLRAVVIPLELSGVRDPNDSHREHMPPSEEHFHQAGIGYAMLLYSKLDGLLTEDRNARLAKSVPGMIKAIRDEADTLRQLAQGINETAEDTRLMKHRREVVAAIFDRAAEHLEQLPELTLTRSKQPLVRPGAPLHPPLIKEYVALDPHHAPFPGR